MQKKTNKKPTTSFTYQLLCSHFYHLFQLQLSCGVSVCDVNTCNETTGAFRQSNQISLVVEVSKHVCIMMCHIY